MGLTSGSTGNSVLDEDMLNEVRGFGYTIGLAGNPNVGKSTVFNGITGMHQHTGNWPGKTVGNAIGKCNYKNKDFLLVDIPGTYSLMSNSEEEEIARDYICFGNSDVTVVVVDATCLERNLNLVFQTLEIKKNVIVCVNLLDEAKKKGIKINLDLLSKELGVPVVGITARKTKTLNMLLDVIYNVCIEKVVPSPVLIKYCDCIESAIGLLLPEVEKLITYNSYLCRWICIKLLDGDELILKSLSESLSIDLLNDKSLMQKVEDARDLLVNNGISTNDFRDNIVCSILSKSEEICNKVCVYENKDYNEKDRKIDKVLTSKVWGIPIMLGFLGIVFWLTITGANYPSSLLSNFFSIVQDNLYVLFDFFHAPNWLSGLLIDGMYQTLAWVVSVMLPPMAIFFPLFTFLEDLGYLPRIAFNLDNCFKRCHASGKQALTMCMGVTKWDFFIISPS